MLHVDNEDITLMELCLGSPPALAVEISCILSIL